MHPLVEYSADRDGIIRTFSKSGAEENDSSQLYVGKTLFDFWTPNVRPLLSGVHAAVLRLGSPLTLEHRCDDFDTEHHMRLSLQPQGDHIKYTSELRFSKPRSVPILYGGTEGPLVAMCGWCNDVARAPMDKQWRPVIHVVHDVPMQYQVSHGICEPCEYKLLDSFD